MANSKTYATSGTTAGTLAPTLALPNGTNVELITMASGILVMVSNATGTFQIGANVYFAVATGILALGTSTPASHEQIPNARLVRRVITGATGGTLAVIELT